VRMDQTGVSEIDDCAGRAETRVGQKGAADRTAGASTEPQAPGGTKTPVFSGRRVFAGSGNVAWIVGGRRDHGRRFFGPTPCARVSICGGAVSSGREGFVPSVARANARGRSRLGCSSLF